MKTIVNKSHLWAWHFQSAFKCSALNMNRQLWITTYLWKSPEMKNGSKSKTKQNNQKKYPPKKTQTNRKPCGKTLPESEDILKMFC